MTLLKRRQPPPAPDKKEDSIPVGNKIKQVVDGFKKESKKPSASSIRQKVFSVDSLIPTGSTLLNLALSDNAFGGYLPGRIYNVIGDSDSGKTFLVLTGMAEVANNKRFDKYKLIYDDAEFALSFDIKYLFGKIAHNRIHLLRDDAKKEEDRASKTIEDFRRRIWRELDKKEPFIYILDSLDSVTSIDEQIRFEEERKNGKLDKGSYKTEKPRALSELLRVINGPLKETNSVLIIVSQTRDTIGFSAMFKPKTRAGGRALKFYCSAEIWAAAGKKEKQKERVIGGATFLNVTKNKITGKKRGVESIIYYDYGLDDITANLDFLIENRHIKKGTRDGEKSKYIWREFDIVASKKDMIKIIEDEGLTVDLAKDAETVWNEIEESIRLTDRKRKYE